MERRALSADQNVLMTHLVVWLLALVSGILLGLRLFTKWLRAQQLWSDDGFLIASWVSHTRAFLPVHRFQQTTRYKTSY